MINLQKFKEMFNLKRLLNESPTEMTTMSGDKIPIKCSVKYISFSAHTDFKQTTQFIRALKPPHIVSS